MTSPGVTIISPDLAPKRMQMLGSLPGVTRVAVLRCLDSQVNHEEFRRASAAASQFGLHVESVEYRQKATRWQAIEAAIERARPQALYLQDCTTMPFKEIQAVGSPSSRLAGVRLEWPA